MTLKFRVWDETQREMLQVDCIEFIDGKAYWVEASPADGIVQGVNDGPIGGNSQLKLEQFTGLKDANGKEIYEDDVLENPKYRSVVKFESGSFYADVIGAANRFTLAGEWQTSVVIGNVHTSPELLEAQHG